MLRFGQLTKPPVATVGFVTPEIAAPVGFVPNANEIAVLVVTMFPYASDTSADGGFAQAKPARQENGGGVARGVRAAPAPPRGAPAAPRHAAPWQAPAAPSRTTLHA